MPLYPYTNSQELNLDWILQVVKDFQTKYTTFDQALADALEAIETAKDGGLEDMQNALADALDAINVAIGGIDDAKDAALLALQQQLTAALTTLTNAQTEAATSIENLYNTLPSSDRQILGRLSILNGIITGAPYPDMTWIQGTYIYPEGVTPPTPPAPSTDEPSYSTIVTLRYIEGAAGMRFRIQTDSLFVIDPGVLVWRNNPPGGEVYGFLPSEIGGNEHFIDFVLPLDVTAFSIQIHNVNPDLPITPSDIVGHVNLQWITDFVNQAVIAPKESSLTADVARNTGEYFFWEGVLYKATANISIGDTIVLSGAGANCEEAQIGADLCKMVQLPSNPQSGQYIKFDGSAWIAADLPTYQGGVTNG